MRAVKISVRPKPKIPVIPFRCKVYKEAKNDLTLKFGFFCQSSGIFGTGCGRTLHKMTTHVIVNSNGIRMTIDVPLMIWQGVGHSIQHQLAQNSRDG